VYRPLVNAFESLQQRLQAERPTLKLVISRPVQHDGVWTLDCVQDGTWVVVEWDPSGSSFGVSKVTSQTGYGEPPDQCFTDGDLAFRRIVQLLNGLTDAPPLL
jgi:hypothetical protein